MTFGRRRRLRLLCRDVGAGVAFAAMAISGQLPAWALALFAASLLLALLDVRLLSGRSAFTALGLVAAALAFGAMVVLGAFDAVIAAGTFAAMVAAQRLLSLSTPAADGQVHLTSLLMIAGGAAMSADLAFAACLGAFAIFGCLSLGLGVIEESTPDGEEVPLGPMMVQLSWGVLFAMLGAIAFFIVIPRLSWNMAARRTPQSLLGAVTGVADSVRLDGPGTIKRNPRVVARIQLDPDPAVADLDAYWVAKTYTRFTGFEWISPQAAPEPRRMKVDLADYTHPLIRQQIELLPSYGARTLIALQPPVRFASAVAHGPAGSVRAALDHLPGQEVRFADVGSRYTYWAFSPPPDDRRAMRYLPGREELLELPEGLDPRIPELAKALAGDARDPMVVAERIERHLKANLAYTLELSPSEDPLADFLFVRKAGHCEHFATAMAVMLRSLNIPARVAGGFFGGKRVGDRYVLRAADAHAWAELLVPGVGFVTVDATPEDLRGGQPSALLAFLNEQLERLDDLWRRAVVDYTIVDQADLARQLVRPPRARGAQGPLPSLDWSALAASLAVGVGAYWLLRLALRTRATAPSARAAAAATRFLDQIERRLDRARVRRADGEQIEELSRRLSMASHPLATPLSRASRRYLEARFGGAALPALERDELLSGLERASDR